jgi:hypothetical protein
VTEVARALLDELRALAHRDGVVSDDEAALIAEMELGLGGFVELFAAVRRDHRLDWHEFLWLRRARADIFARAVRRAFADEVVTDDERQLLIRIAERLPDLR